VIVLHPLIKSAPLKDLDCAASIFFKRHYLQGLDRNNCSKSLKLEAIKEMFSAYWLSHRAMHL